MKVFVVVLPTGMTILGRGDEIGENTLRITKPFMVQFMEHPRQPGNMVPQAMPYSIVPGITAPKELLVLRPGQYVDFEEADAQMEALYSKVAFGLEVPKSGIQLASR